MVVFFYGTTGEIIKIATLVESIPKDKRLLVDTNQQPGLLRKFYKATSFPKPDFTISKGWKNKDLTKPWQMGFWLPVVIKNFLTSGVYKEIRRVKRMESVVIMVHGDTVTTVVGTILGRLMGLKVAHIEAGLRSGNWKHPFPEEIDRRIVSKFARIHYVPGKTPMKALVSEATKGDLISTGANTVADSAIWAKKQKPIGMPKLPFKNFCLVSVHRNEFLISPKQVEAFLDSIHDFASVMPIVFLDHPITVSRISSLKLDSKLKHKNIIRVPKQNYVNMMHLIDEASVIVTDSGGLQEESYYLGIPCIVHRAATERDEGLGENVVLTGLDAKRLTKELGQFKVKLKRKTKRKFEPTKIIVNNLKERKYV